MVDFVRTFDVLLPPEVTTFLSGIDLKKLDEYQNNTYWQRLNIRNFKQRDSSGTRRTPSSNVAPQFHMVNVSFLETKIFIMTTLGDKTKPLNISY